IELKKKYKYRLILDESLSFGTLGPRGAGLTDHFKVPVSDVEFVVGSLAHALCSSGGFCAGTHQICDHQRLSGLSYCFSASLPALLAVAASEGLNHIRDGEKVRKSGESVCLRDLRENGAAILHILSNVRGIETAGAPGSPVVHLRLRSGVVPERESAVAEDGPFVSKQASKRKSVEAKRQEEERILQDIVDMCAKDGVLVTRAKYLWTQEVNPPAPSIRICATSALTKRETEKAANIIKSACARVIARRR
ncbi:MAG: pyridoxal phosphate-dependent transferase, partial [Olpidium bornovanus]